MKYHLDLGMNYYVKMWERAAVFGGRATRAEYWYAFLVHTAIGAILSAIARGGSFMPALGGLYAIASLIPHCALFARRLHDVGKSGLWWFAPTIPLLLSCLLLMAGLFYFSGSLIFLGALCGLAALAAAAYATVLLARQGMAGPNQYGADPRSSAGALPGGER